MCHDEKLIQKAIETPFQDWGLIDNLIADAISLEAINKLRNIQLEKFREEENANYSL